MGRRVSFGVLRGLALGLTLSVVNFFGVLLTLTAMGGLEPWTRTQFIGLFGLVELATGVAFVVGPNIWRLPVAEARLRRAPGEVRFAASTVLIPHWAGGVKSIAGAVFVAWAATEGVAPATAGIVPVTFAVCAVAVGVSMAFARLGVARPDLDVYEIAIRRPLHEERLLPPVSLGAAFVQLVLNILAFPAVKVLSPGALYTPALAPSADFVAGSVAVGLLALALGFGAWWGRLAWQAPRRQQREAEEFAKAS